MFIVDYVADGFNGDMQFFASFSSNFCLEASNNMYFLQSKIAQGSIFLMLLSIDIHSSELLEATQRKSIKRIVSKKKKNVLRCAIFRLNFLIALF